jgi:ribosomal-protein-alanine N-acetyltransferase
MTAPHRIYRIEAGDERDIDDVAALEAESFTNPWTRAMLANELRESPSARLYGLRVHSGELAAFCACWIVADELHVNTVAVSPAFRRLGLGSALMREVMEQAAAAGAVRATLEVRRSNVPALRLYAALGFKIEAERPRYYTQPEEDALILWNQQLRVPNSRC